jgi:hypothetical protein
METKITVFVCQLSHEYNPLNYHHHHHHHSFIHSFYCSSSNPNR